MISEIYLGKEKGIRKVLNKEKSVKLNDFAEMKLNFSFRKFKKLGEGEYKINELKITKEIIDFLEKICNGKVKDSKIFCFEHGDYTLMCDSVNEKNGFKAIFDLNDFDEEFGGYHSFVKNGEEIIRVVPEKNCLTIIKTDNSMKSFVKYVNCLAGGSKRIFIEIKFI